MLCANFQNDWATKTDVKDERDFAKFAFMMGIRGMLY